MHLLKPPRLRRGDLIGLIAPASAPLDMSLVERGVRYLEGLGYRTAPGKHIGERHGYLAGEDQQRVADLNGFLRDREVRAIFPLRGGYGTPRLLPLVDYGAARRDPKILVGYSDITALQMALYRRAGWVTFAGPMLTSDLARRRNSFAEEQFWRMLTSAERVGDLPHPRGKRLVTRHAGRAEGRLVGTNLSLLVSSLGTPYSPDYRGTLLVLEDVHEQLHRLDRMLTQLRNAGVWARINGLVLGAFTKCRPGDPRQPYLSQAALFSEALGWLSQPTVSGLAFGHVPAKLTIPLGCLARVNADEGRLEVLECGVC